MQRGHCRRFRSTFDTKYTLVPPSPRPPLYTRSQYVQDYKLALGKLCELKVQVLHHWLTAKQVGLGIATTCMYVCPLLLYSHPSWMKIVTRSLPCRFCSTSGFRGSVPWRSYAAAHATDRCPQSLLMMYALAREALGPRFCPPPEAFRTVLRVFGHDQSLPRRQPTRRDPPILARVRAERLQYCNVRHVLLSYACFLVMAAKNR